MNKPLQDKNWSEVDAARLIYDGECPFCANYVALLRIREHIKLELIDAREASAETMDIVAMGYDLDQGFVLSIAEHYYFGDEAMHVLALLGTRSTMFNRLNKFVFSQPKLASTLYPVLRFLRNLILRLLGRRQLNLSAPSKP